MLSFTFNDGNISTVTTIVYPAFMDAVGVSKAEPWTQSGAVLPDKSLRRSWERHTGLVNEKEE